MSQTGTPPPTGGAGVGGTIQNDAELDRLREKLQILQQIQQLQGQLNPTHNEGVAGSSGTQPAMRVKPPVGSYSMTPAEYRSYKKDCTSFKKLTNLTDEQVGGGGSCRMPLKLDGISQTMLCR